MNRKFLREKYKCPKGTQKMVHIINQLGYEIKTIKYHLPPHIKKNKINNADVDVGRKGLLYTVGVYVDWSSL